MVRYYELEHWERAGETVIITCPGCGQGASLSKHEITEPYGCVHPSFVCPHEGCDFHDWIRLDMWGNIDE